MLPQERRFSFQFVGDFPVKEWLSKLFTLKNKINKIPSFYLICKSKCNIFNGIYYCKSKSHFRVTAGEHLGIIPLTGKNVKSLTESTAFNHIFHTGHNASFHDFETLVKESDEFRLLLRDLFFILRDDLLLWNIFHNYLQFNFIISIIVVTLLTIWLSNMFNMKFVRIKQWKSENASRENSFIISIKMHISYT